MIAGADTTTEDGGMGKIISGFFFSPSSPSSGSSHCTSSRSKTTHSPRSQSLPRLGSHHRLPIMHTTKRCSVFVSHAFLTCLKSSRSRYHATHTGCIPVRNLGLLLLPLLLAMLPWSTFPPPPPPPSVHQHKPIPFILSNTPNTCLLAHSLFPHAPSSSSSPQPNVVLNQTRFGGLRKHFTFFEGYSAVF